MSERPISEEQLTRIYDALDDEEAKMVIRRIFRDTERLESEGGRVNDARLEGFGAGLFLGTLLAMEQSMGMGGTMFGDLESLYPEDPNEFEREDIDVAADELVEELESLEGEGVEETMFEPMDDDGYGVTD